MKRVGISSDSDAIRDHVVTEEEEKAYFTTCLTKFEIERKDGTKEKHGPFRALRDVARVILDQGMRPDDVLNLLVQDVDFEKGAVKVNQGKTKSARRTLVLTPAVRAIMAKRVGDRTHGSVFEGQKPGKHLTKVNNPHNAVLKRLARSSSSTNFGTRSRRDSEKRSGTHRAGRHSRSRQSEDGHALLSSAG